MAAVHIHRAARPVDLLVLAMALALPRVGQAMPARETLCEQGMSFESSNSALWSTMQVTLTASSRSASLEEVVCAARRSSCQAGMPAKDAHGCWDGNQAEVRIVPKKKEKKKLKCGSAA